MGLRRHGEAIQNAPMQTPMRRSALALASSLCAASAVWAQASHEQVNEANNPLTPKITFNLHDYYAPRLYDLSGHTNSALLRGVLPHKLGGAPQIFRATLPVNTAPDAAGNSTTGLGDLNLIDMLLFKEGGVELGIGPQLTIPTATKDETGTGKWQAGLAGIAIAPQKWGLIGGLLTWQHSFAGDDDRRTQNNLLAQPFFIYNFPKGRGWYFRSTATWTWDLELDTYFIPVGAGIGKVWKGGTTTYNAFVEPQWTVDHDGEGVPKLQIFFGLNLQFPL